MPHNPTVFGAWLYKERARQNLSRERLAQMANVAPATIKFIETGHVMRPNKRTREALTRTLCPITQTIRELSGSGWDGAKVLPIGPASVLSLRGQKV